MSNDRNVARSSSEEVNYQSHETVLATPEDYALQHKFSDSHITEVALARFNRLPPGRVEGFCLQLPMWPLWAMGLLPAGTSRTSALQAVVVWLLALFILVQSVKSAALLAPRVYASTVTACYAMGCLVGLAHLRRRDYLCKCDRLESKPLDAYARVSGFLDAWQRRSAKRFVVVLMSWACASVARGVSFFMPDCAQVEGEDFSVDERIASLVCFTIISGIMAALVFLQLHVFGGLESAVDNFCVQFALKADYRRAMGQWGIVPALLRHGARTVGGCFVATGMCTAAAFAVTMAQLFSAPRGTMGAGESYCFALWSGWVLPPVALLVYTVCCAAAVTEKCDRVPPFVMALASKKGATESGRLHAAQHIMHSRAGLDIKGVRLSGAFALHLSFLLAIALFMAANWVIPWV